MSNKISAKFINQSDQYIRITIFERVKNEQGNEEARIVFVGTIPSHGYQVIEIDDAIWPWACIAKNDHRVGGIIPDLTQITSLDIRNFNNGEFYVTQW